MAGGRRTNYKQEKRNKELEKQRKKDAKKERKTHREPDSSEPENLTENELL
ncbi:MAG: hypothetical protein PHI97_07055 [Desulfobulbus sp.]|nr:hypothetical protein [Desulfobulbus sp.]